LGGERKMVTLRLCITYVFVFISALVTSWFGGRKQGETDAKVKGLQEYADTRKRMDEVGRMSDADAAAEWLRNRSKQ